MQVLKEILGHWLDGQEVIVSARHGQSANEGIFENPKVNTSDTLHPHTGNDVVCSSPQLFFTSDWSYGHNTRETDPHCWHHSPISGPDCMLSFPTANPYFWYHSPTSGPDCVHLLSTRGPGGWHLLSTQDTKWWVLLQPRSKPLAPLPHNRTRSARSHHQRPQLKCWTRLGSTPSQTQTAGISDPCNVIYSKIVDGPPEKRLKLGKKLKVRGRPNGLTQSVTGLPSQKNQKGTKWNNQKSSISHSGGHVIKKKLEIPNLSLSVNLNALLTAGKRNPLPIVRTPRGMDEHCDHPAMALYKAVSLIDGRDFEEILEHITKLSGKTYVNSGGAYSAMCGQCREHMIAAAIILKNFLFWLLQVIHAYLGLLTERCEDITFLPSFTMSVMEDGQNPSIFFYPKVCTVYQTLNKHVSIFSKDFPGLIPLSLVTIVPSLKIRAVEFLPKMFTIWFYQ